MEYIYVYLVTGLSFFAIWLTIFIARKTGSAVAMIVLYLLFLMMEFKPYYIDLLIGEMRKMYYRILSRNKI